MSLPKRQPRSAPVGVSTSRSTVVLVGTALVALSVAAWLHPDPWPGEVGYVRWLQGLGEPVPSIGDFVRFATGTEGNLIVGIPVAAVLVRRFGRRGAAAVGVMLVAMLAVQPGMKELLDRPRPDGTEVEVRAEPVSESFPSGHSLSTTTVWGVAALLAWRDARRGIAAVLVSPIAITGVSSAVQGVHWPSDAVAGTLVGVLAIAAVAETTAVAGGEPQSTPGSIT